MSMINTISERLKQETSLFVGFLVFMSNWNLVLGAKMITFFSSAASFNILSLSMTNLDCLFDLILHVPVNNFSVMSG